MIPMVLVERRLLEEAAEALPGSAVRSEIERVLGQDGVRRRLAREAGTDWQSVMRDAKP